MSAMGSVWQWDDLMYDYYKIPGPRNLGGFEELDGLGRSKPQDNPNGIGIDIEDALPTLPRNAVRTIWVRSVRHFRPSHEKSQREKFAFKPLGASIFRC